VFCTDVTTPAESPGPAEPVVVFFWRPGCVFCSLLRSRLERAGVTLDERNIWDDDDAAAFVRSVASGNETVPTVVVAGTPLVNPPAKTVLGLLGREPAGALDRLRRR
jgi:mycoredoxin